MNHSKIFFVVPRFPVVSETFVVNHFVRNWRHYPGTYIQCQSYLKKDLDRFYRNSGIPVENILCTPPHENLLLFLVSCPWIFLQLLISWNTRFFSLLNHYWDIFGKAAPKHMYLDFQFLMHRPDLIHFEFGTLAGPKMYLKKIFPVRVVVSFRGYDLNFVGLQDPSYYERVWKEADAIHFLGEYLKSLAYNRGWREEQPYRSIPPAIDLSLFKRAQAYAPPEAGKPLRILGMARLAWQKGYENILSAMAELKKMGVPFVYEVIGQGHMYEALTFCRHAYGLEEDVHLLGVMDQGQARKHLDECHVFVHGPISEGFCNAVIEAQAMEIPVLVTDTGGLPENIEDGVTGKLVPLRNPVEMARNLRWFYEHPDKCISMGKAGRERVKEHFVLERQTEAFLELYESILPLRD